MYINISGELERRFGRNVMSAEFSRSRSDMSFLLAAAVAISNFLHGSVLQSIMRELLGI